MHDPVLDSEKPSDPGTESPTQFATSHQKHFCLYFFLKSWKRCTLRTANSYLALEIPPSYRSATMKALSNKTWALVLVIVMPMLAFGQSPQLFNYQGIARDNAGNPLTDQNIALRLSILSGSTSGPATYSETQTTATNTFGLFNVRIGSGVPVSGNFSSIDWSSDSHFLQVEIDPNGNSNYQHAGTSQLLSVPYALYAENSGTAATANISVLQDTDQDTKIQVEKNADEDIIRFDMAGTERWVMTGRRLEPKNNGNSIFIGASAGANDNQSFGNNVAIGHQTLMFNSTGQGNTAVGMQTLQYNSSGSGNTAMGIYALSSNTTGVSNTSV